ncbi:MAG: DUF2007 domain-containing protein [Lentimicrobiaceae bacterium]|jgi:hypothetical protein
MSKEDKSLTPYEVFAGSPWEAGLLKSILEDNDIETIIQQSTALPMNIWPTDAATMKVYVALKDYEQAKAIVEEFYTNMEKENSNGSPE